MSKNIFSTPDQYVVKKNWRHFSICDRNEDTPAMRVLLQAPDKTLVKVILKNHDTTRVVMTQINGKEFVIKRYNIKNFWHGLKRALQPTRAVHCWFISHLLMQYGIKTPKAIAIMENRIGLIRREGFFIYEYIAGQAAVDIFTADQLKDDDVLKKADNLILLIKNLFAHRLYQRDMNPTNFIFVGNTPYIIDLDGMRKNYFAFSQRKIAKTVKRFLQYWDTKPEVKNLFAEIINRTEDSY